MRRLPRGKTFITLVAPLVQAESLLPASISCGPTSAVDGAFAVVSRALARARASPALRALDALAPGAGLILGEQVLSVTPYAVRVVAQGGLHISRVSVEIASMHTWHSTTLCARERNSKSSSRL